jgi:CHAT domain-containing protein
MMDRLYTEMVLDHTPEEALRTAKLSLAHSQGTFRKPFYWAAFQVYAGS